MAELAELRSQLESCQMETDAVARGLQKAQGEMQQARDNLLRLDGARMMLERLIQQSEHPKETEVKDADTG